MPSSVNDRSDPPVVNRRRELTAAALLCAVGAGAAVVAGGRSWATVQARDTITPMLQAVTGRELAAGAVALGWAGLAGLAALFATRGKIRAAVGGLLALFGAAIAYASATAVGRSHVLEVAADRSALLQQGADAVVRSTGWPAVSLGGGVLLAVAGVVILLRGARWPGMSARYDTAGAERRPEHGDDASALWKSLDRGEDPTADRGDGPAGHGAGRRGAAGDVAGDEER
jgi:uncharacterized membrane protein (TIGR02234 family)